MSDERSPANYYLRIQRGEIAPPACSRTLGTVSVATDADAGTAEFVFEAPATLTNPVGAIQGGFLSAMLDDAMSIAVVMTLPSGQYAPTLSMTTQFHAPARPGRLVARGWITMRGRSVCHMAGELEQNGKVVASATATAVIRTLPASTGEGLG